MKQIGPHRLTNLSIDDPGVDRLFSDGRKATVLYSDPPWGDGNVKYWATMASKDSGAHVVPLSYDRLLDALFSLITRHVAGHVFLETGHRWESENVRRMEHAGLANIARVELSYDNGRQTNVLLFGSFLDGRVDLSPLAGASGVAVPTWAVRQFADPGGIVFDPCCGMGYSAAAALVSDMQFRGNELNAKRLAKTAARLS